MVKTFKHKKLSKRILALLLALVTVMSCFLMVPFSVQADSLLKDWNGHSRMSVDGKDAFCINFGLAASGTFKKDSDAVKYWNALGSTKQNKIRQIITYAGELGYLNDSDEKYFGVQRAIWAVVSNESEKELSSWFKSQTKTYYDTLNSGYSSYSNTTPNFTSSIVNLLPESSAADAVYVGSTTDKKKVLSNWEVGDKGGLNHVSISGNTVNVRNKTSFNDTKKVVLQSKYKYYKIPDDNVGKFGDQQVIAIGTPETLTKGFKVTARTTPILTGAINARKVDEYGNPKEGVQFDLYDAYGNYLDSDFSDATGYVEFTDLEYGTYLLREIVPSGYLAYKFNDNVQLVVNSTTPITATNDERGTWTNVRAQAARERALRQQKPSEPQSKVKIF